MMWLRGGVGCSSNPSRMHDHWLSGDPGHPATPSRFAESRDIWRSDHEYTIRAMQQEKGVAGSMPLLIGVLGVWPDRHDERTRGVQRRSSSAMVFLATKSHRPRRWRR